MLSSGLCIPLLSPTDWSASGFSSSHDKITVCQVPADSWRLEAGGWFLPVWNISEPCGVFLQEKQNRTKPWAAECCLCLQYFSVWSTILTTADVTAATVAVSMAVNITANIVKNLMQMERLLKRYNTSAKFPVSAFDAFAYLFLLVFLRKPLRRWFGALGAA